MVDLWTYLNEKFQTKESLSEKDLVFFQEKMRLINSQHVLPRFKQLQLYMKECLNIKFDDKPDYSRLKGILKNLFITQADVPAEEHKCGSFWEGPHPLVGKNKELMENLSLISCKLETKQGELNVKSSSLADCEVSLKSMQLEMARKETEYIAKLT